MIDLKTLKHYIDESLDMIYLFTDGKIKVKEYSKNAIDLVDQLTDCYDLMWDNFESIPRELREKLESPLYEMSIYLAQAREGLDYKVWYFVKKLEKMGSVLQELEVALDEYEDSFVYDSLKIKDDKTSSYKEALKLAKKLNKPVVYGYTSKRNPNKFFEIRAVEWDGNDKAFRAQYGANVIYVAYPDKK